MVHERVGHDAVKLSDESMHPVPLELGGGEDAGTGSSPRVLEEQLDRSASDAAGLVELPHGQFHAGAELEACRGAAGVDSGPSPPRRIVSRVTGEV